MILAGTGHRLEVLGGPEMFPKVVEYATSILPQFKPTKIISGMAVGWDQALALAALERGIPLIAAVPFVGQEHVWPQEAKDLYHSILKRATEVVIVCEGGYATHKYHERDKWMVDTGEAVLALWNGQKQGGTWSTVKYAEKVAKKPVLNVWPGWMVYNEPESGIDTLAVFGV